MRLLIIIAILFLAACNTKRTSNYHNNEFNARQDELGDLLMPGFYSATVTSHKELNRDQKKVIEKFLKYALAHEDLEEEFNKLWEHPEQVDLAKHFGLNKNESKILLSIFTNKETETSQDSLVIINNNNVISFKGKDKLKFLDSLTINSRDSSAMIRLPNKDMPEYVSLNYTSPSLSDEKNTFIDPQEKLQRIVVFTGPTGIGGLLSMGNKYKLIVAQLAVSGKTWLFFETKGYNMTNPAGEFYAILLN